MYKCTFVLCCAFLLFLPLFSATCPSDLEVRGLSRDILPQSSFDLTIKNTGCRPLFDLHIDAVLMDPALEKYLSPENASSLRLSVKPNTFSRLESNDERRIHIVVDIPAELRPHLSPKNEMFIMFSSIEFDAMERKHLKVAPKGNQEIVQEKEEAANPLARKEEEQPALPVQSTTIPGTEEPPEVVHLSSSPFILVIFACTVLLTFLFFVRKGMSEE